MSASGQKRTSLLPLLAVLELKDLARGGQEFLRFVRSCSGNPASFNIVLDHLRLAELKSRQSNALSPNRNNKLLKLEISTVDSSASCITAAVMATRSIHFIARSYAYGVEDSPKPVIVCSRPASPALYATARSLPP